VSFGGGLVEVNEPGEFLAGTEYRHPLVWRGVQWHIGGVWHLNGLKQSLSLSYFLIFQESLI
jgi:hypothetical protein